jgi:hypothetical protein
MMEIREEPQVAAVLFFQNVVSPGKDIMRIRTLTKN